MVTLDQLPPGTRILLRLPWVGCPIPVNTRATVVRSGRILPRPGAQTTMNGFSCVWDSGDANRLYPEPVAWFSTSNFNEYFQLDDGPW